MGTGSARDLSMLLEALLKTQKSSSLRDIMNKNGTSFNDCASSTLKFITSIDSHIGYVFQGSIMIPRISFISIVAYPTCKLDLYEPH